MKIIPTIIFSLICFSLSITDKRLLQFNYEITNDRPYPYFFLELGSKKSILTNFIFSLYYPCIIYYLNSEDYNPSSSSSYKEIAKNVYLQESLYDVAQETFYFLEGDTLTEIEFEKMNFLINSKNYTDEEETSGFIGLSPGIDPTKAEGLLKDSKDQYNVGTLNLLYTNGQIKNKIFSFGPMKKNTDGSFNGTVYLGGTHTDFMTLKEGKTFSCKNNNDFYWGLDVQKIIFPNENKSINLNEKIILNNNVVSGIFPSKYLSMFLESFPKENGCKVYDENKYIACNSWSTDNINLILPFEVEEEGEKITYDLSVTIDDLSDLYGEERRHFIFRPNIKFSDEVSEIYFPMMWFRDYHILFDMEKKEITFHSFDQEKIKIEGEKNEDKGNYLKINKSTFVILCILAGVVIVALILFLGYLKIQNKNTGKGASKVEMIRKVNSGDALYKRQTSYDSSLLGKSSDAMPRRIKTLKIKSSE